MDITIAPADLAHALRLFPTRAVTSSATALGINAADGCASIHAGNAQFGIETVIPATVSVAGAVTVPGGLLTDVITALPREPVQFTVERDDGRLRVRCGHWQVEVATIASVEVAAPVAAARGHVLVVSALALRNALAHVAFAAADDSERPVLTAVLWELTARGLTLAAADGFRLARARIPVVSAGAEQWLVPAPAMREIGHILSEVHEDGGPATVRVALSADGRTLHLRVGPDRFWVRLMIGSYPALERIVPSAWRTRVFVNRVHLQQAIDLTRAFDGTSRICAARLAASPGRLRVTADGGDGGDVAGDLAAEVEGKQGTVALNILQLADILATLRGPGVELSWTDGRTPVAIRDPLRTDPADLWLLMPLAGAASTTTKARSA